MDKNTKPGGKSMQAILS